MEGNLAVECQKHEAGQIQVVCQNSPLLILGSLKRRREDSVCFLEITCHVRFVSDYLFSHLFLHSLQQNGGIQHVQMPALHLEIRRVNTGIGRCKTHD